MNSIDKTDLFLEDDTLDSDTRKEIRSQALKQADKIIRKNKREIERLKEHIQQCVLNINRAGWVYATNKLRVMMRQPEMDKNTASVLWNSLMNEYAEIVKRSM